jgi:U4/U6.U5 tri-snRNP-associated protein 1
MTADIDDHGDQMPVDQTNIVPRARNLDANFVDDDELQAALARSRKAKLHKAKKLSPEDLAKKSPFSLLSVLCFLLTS